MTETDTRRRGAIPEFDFADRIRRAMRHAGIGTGELAERLKISRNTVSSWIGGQHKPRSRDIEAIAEICGVDLEWLLFGYVGKDGLSRGTRRYLDSAGPSEAAGPGTHELLTLRTSPITALRQRVPSRTHPANVAIRSQRVAKL